VIYNKFKTENIQERSFIFMGSYKVGETYKALLSDCIHTFQVLEFGSGDYENFIAILWDDGTEEWDYPGEMDRWVEDAREKEYRVRDIESLLLTDSPDVYNPHSMMEDKKESKSLNRKQIIELIIKLINDAIDETKVNAKDYPDFITNCKQALEFIESIRRKKKEYILVRIAEKDCAIAVNAGEAYLPWQINIRISDWLSQPLCAFKTAEDALKELERLQKEEPFWD
jgi:hypothetical protein